MSEPDSEYPGGVVVDLDGQVRLELFQHRAALGEAVDDALENGTTVYGTTREGGSISLFCKGMSLEAWRGNGFNETSWRVERFVDGVRIDLSGRIGLRSLSSGCDALVPLLANDGYRSEATDGDGPDETLSVRFSRAAVCDTTIHPTKDLTITLAIYDTGTIDDRKVEMRRTGHVTWSWEDAHTLVFDGSDSDVQATATMIAALLNHPIRFADIRGKSWAADDTSLRIVLPHLVGLNARPPDRWDMMPLTFRLRQVGWHEYAHGWWNAWSVAQEPLTRWHRMMGDDRLPLEWSFFLKMSCFESLLLTRHGETGSKWLVDKNGATLRLRQAMERFESTEPYSDLLTSMGLLTHTYFPDRGTDRKAAFTRMCELRNAIAHGDVIDGDGRIGPFAARLESTKHLRRLVELMILENMGVAQADAVDIVGKFVRP